MDVRSLEFKQRSVIALDEPNLQKALKQGKAGFQGNRARAIDLVPEWQQIRSDAKVMKDHTLENLDYYLLQYEAAVEANGGKVHWAPTAADANRIITELVTNAEAKLVVKGKSMVSEEVALNSALEAAGVQTVETDLGEYIIQLAGEPPSHIIAPAAHKTKEQVSDLFEKAHGGPRIEDRPGLVTQARHVLREKFMTADIGITGANLFIAESGQHVLVTNEGNGDLCSSVPKVQIVITSIDKIVPTLEDAAATIRLLARSGTGQHISNYTSLYGGPKAADELDGPEQYHVVLVDNGRSTMLGNAFRDMLRCIRCGACMNHCPVYGNVGGHAYGWVYPGPMGSVLTPNMVGLEQTMDLPNACTMNGRCAEVCPMSIPLPDLLREHRRLQFQRGLGGKVARGTLAAWAAVAKKPSIYQTLTRPAVKVMSYFGGKSGVYKTLPGLGSWTSQRDLPAPQGDTFMAQWRKQQKSKKS